MTLTGFALSLVLTLGQGPATLEVGGWVAFETASIRSCGLTPLPFLVLTNSSGLCRAAYPDDAMLRHEVVHIRQMEALGPALPVAYVLTGGRPFEDYLEGFDPVNYDLGESMWDPGPTNNCPHLRISDSVQFFPCWRF